MTTDSIFNVVKPIFDAHRNNPSVEIEIRFGKIIGNKFEADVGKDIFYTIMGSLESYNRWELVSNTKHSIYYHGHNRYMIDEETNETTYMSKKKLLNQNFKIDSHPLDIRFSVSEENIIPGEPGDVVMDMVKMRTRKSFVRKNLSIDLSIVGGDPDDLDNEEPEIYQIELEIVKPQSVKNDDELYNLLHKIECILKVL